MDTIFAQATAHGKAGVAVVRVSGPDAVCVCEALTGVRPSGRDFKLRKIMDSDGAVLDVGLVLSFEAEHSFTGEDVIEFQVHGSTAVVAALLRRLGELPNLRLAEPGEFTRRALENGCLDLSQVEGLSDLIEAETEAQRRQAIRVFDGALGDRVAEWRDDLVRAAALLEATIDFADEDVPEDVTPEVVELLSRVAVGLAAELEGADAAERIRDGFEVAILGAPNAGKSTLLNALAGREAAITSSIAGTTRDIIEVRMEVGGLPVTFLDTAGLRESEDEIERIGIDRAVSRAKRADLRIFLADSTSAQDLPLEPEKDDLVVLGKSDLREGEEGISGKTGHGLSKLISDIQNVLESRASNASLAIRERHRIGMVQASDALNLAVHQLDSGSGSYELVSEDIRAAARFLDAMIGKIDVENLLDEIFANFCLGK